jgi:hypothetical protein
MKLLLPAILLGLALGVIARLHAIQREIDALKARPVPVRYMPRPSFRLDRSDLEQSQPWTQPVPEDGIIRI